MCCFHIGIVRHAAVYLAANGNPAFGPEAQSLCPIDDRLSAGLYSNLVEPGIARFREGLDEIEETTIAFLPIVKRQIANLDRWDALILLAGSNRAAFQCRDADRNLEGRAGRVGRTKCAWQQRNPGIILQGLELFWRDRRNEKVWIVIWPRRSGENVAFVRIHDHDRTALC